MKHAPRSNVVPFVHPDRPETEASPTEPAARADASRTRLTLEPHHRKPFVAALAIGALHGAAVFVQGLREEQHPSHRSARKKLLASPRNDTGEFMDEKELCSTLGIASVTATKWRAKAEGPPFVKLGRLIRYRRSDVASWLQARHHDTAG